MSFLKYPFKAFFQPSELEDYLAKNQAIRRRVAWTHVGLAAGWFVTCLITNYLVFLEDRQVGILLAAMAGLALSLSIYGGTMLVGFACGGLSKRDSLLTFVVSTYWSFVVSLVGLAIQLVLRLSEGYDDSGIQELLANSAILLILIIIASIVVNLHGKTRGMRPAIILAFVIALSMMVISLGYRPSTAIYAYRELGTGGRRVIEVSGYHPRIHFTGILPAPSDRSFLTKLEHDGNSDRYLVKSTMENNSYSYSYDRRIRAFMVNASDLAKLDGKIPGPVLEHLKSLVGQTLPEEQFFNALTEFVPISDSYKKIIEENVSRATGVFIDNEFFIDDTDTESLMPLELDNVRAGRIDDNVSGAALPDDESLRYQPLADGQYDLTRNNSQGDLVWKATLNSKPRFFNSRFSVGGGYSNVILKSGYLYLFTDDRPYVLDFASGRDLSAGHDFSWYPSLFGENPSPMATATGVYVVSPSGYFFAPVVSNGSLQIDRQPVYANELQDFSQRLIPFIFFFYLIGGTLVLCVGLYRIPIFIVESVWQSLVLLKIRRKPAGFDENVKSAPLFFDHISSLPLPFSAAFLARVAKTDERQCAALLMYLLEKTQQKKLAARLAGSFFRDHPSLTFEWIYRLLKPEKKRVFELLNQHVKRETLAPNLPEAQSKQEKRFLGVLHDSRIGSLLEAYQRLMSATPKGPVIGELVIVLRPFADDDYRHARELLLTYEVFAKFYGFHNVEELADADLDLTELQQISVAETLNVNLADTWGIVIELANDLKNYDVVESFRDKQYYLSEARIKLYEITRRAQKNLSDPEAAVLIEIVEKWQELIITEAKVLRGPAELQLALLNKRLAGNGEWNNILITVKNVGQSPAENISVGLLENENVLVLENRKQVRLLGTGDVSNIEFAIMSKGNPSELRMYFDATFDDFERKGKAFTFADVIRLTSTVEEFKKIQNPYVVGIPLQSDKVFYGRRNVLDFALDNLRAGEQNNVLIFYGQRRIGKSSLLYRIKDSPLKSDYLFVYIDCQGFADADTAKLLYRICESIYLAAQERGFSLEAPELEKFKQNTFIELDAFLNRSEEALGARTLVLMLDEYEYLEYKVKDGSVSAEIFNKLRNLMQHRNKKMTFIFVGTHRLQELTSNYWSFLFNTALYYEIGPLGEPEARALITDPVKGYLRYDDLAIDKILRITGMHPYFIQGSCRALVNYCNKRKKNYVTLTDVNEVMREAVESSTAHVKYLYQDYASETEQQVLTFLARLTDDSKLSSTPKEISRFALENGFQFEPGPVQEILAGLKNKRLVREDGEMHEQFGFEYEFLRIWIKEHIKIRNGALITS